MGKVITDRKKIEDVLDRGVVVNILPSREEFVQRLMSGKRIRVYIGADPTSTSLHLSHAKNYMFLEELRKLGHEVIVLVGDFTARIGDPTDRTSARVQLSEKEVKANVKNWLKQIKPLMDFNAKVNPPKVMYNSKWLSKLSFSDVVELASNFTVQQMLERDMFQKRLSEKAPIHMHEFFYPLMQGYDSVAMDVDAELCGTDQTFNALAGRTLMKRLRGKDKFVIAVNLMENPKTGELMSKSRGTGVFLSASPEEMFGQVMAQPDEMIEVLFTNVTRLPKDEVRTILDLGPREAKFRVAFEIVRQFYGDKKAFEAGKKWEVQFSKKEIPNNLEEYAIRSNQKDTDLVDVVAGVSRLSKSQAWKLIQAGAVDYNQERKSNPREHIVIQAGDVVRIGRKLVRLVIK